MTLRQIQYIVEVERLGSLSNAAKALFISQSTLSFAIKDLERELGFPLFERTRTGMRPTELGNDFLAKAHNALEAFSALETQMEHSDKSRTVLRIAAVQSSILSCALYRFLPDYDRQTVPFKLSYRGGSTGEVVDLISGGEYDLGFVYATERQYEAWKQEFQSRGIAAQIICTLDLCVIVSAQDAFAGKEQISLSELSDYTYVFAGDDGLTGFSNLADYSALNFNLVEHRHYFDVQDTQLVNILLHEANRFSIGHKCSFSFYGSGLAYLPLKDPQRIHLLALQVKGLPLTGPARDLLQTIADTAPEFY